MLLLLHHKTVTSDLHPANIISTKLHDMAQHVVNVVIVDPSFPVAVPKVILDEWSDSDRMMMADFKLRNLEIQNPTLKLQTVSAILAQQTSALTHLHYVLQLFNNWPFRWKSGMPFSSSKQSSYHICLMNCMQHKLSSLKLGLSL